MKTLIVAISLVLPVLASASDVEINTSNHIFTISSDQASRAPLFTSIYDFLENIHRNLRGAPCNPIIIESINSLALDKLLRVSPPTQRYEDLERLKTEKAADLPLMSERDASKSEENLEGLQRNLEMLQRYAFGTAKDICSPKQ
jgi:hypothetical protein